MRYRDATGFRRALEQRLKTKAGGDGTRIARDRKHVCFDRLLARLVAVAPGQWLLKGGFALELRLAERARATKDIDLDWRSDEAELFEALIDTTRHDGGDFFVFAVERTHVATDRLGGSHRFRVSVSLGGRRFETFLLDVGFKAGEPIGTDRLRTEDLLGFADIAPVEVEVIAAELQVAEKLHAYTRSYEPARPSTRAKDLVDLVLIAQLCRLDAATLRQAIDTTFERRQSHPVPTRLPHPPAGWAASFRALAQEVGAPRRLSEGHAHAAALLEPILSDEVTTGDWDTGAQRWIVS